MATLRYPMLAARTILGLLSPDALRRLTYTLLGWALVPLGEVYLMVRLADLAGVYLVIAGAAALALTGTWAALTRLRSDVAALRRTVESGTIPTLELGRMAGGVAALFLILSPGYVTDMVGFAILLTRLRDRLGAAILRWTAIDTKEIYEYLRLSETLR